jgi:hypothetical protein
MATKKNKGVDHAQIQVALDVLTHVCQQNGVSLAGFIWNSTDTLYQFGCKLAADPETYEKLCRLANNRRTAGAVRKFSDAKLRVM